MLQQTYDRPTQMVAIMQPLAKMREAQVLKAQVDAAWQKEAMLKECIQPWLDDAFTVSTNIDGNFAHM